MKNLIPTRYWFVFGTFTLSLLLYIDRVCISAAKSPIAESLSLTDTQMGWVLSSFALGYALFQTPSGILADKFGARRVLAIIVTIWSIFTALTGAAWNFLSMLVIRFLFGAGEAGAYPSISSAVFKWIPLKERGLVNGINFSGSRIGAAFALPLVAFLVEAVGWRTSFVIFGVAGLVWALAWFFWFTDKPQDHKGMSDEEKAYITENLQASVQKEQTSNSLMASTLVRSNNMRMAMWQYFCSNFTFFFTLTWLFPYVKTTYGIDAVEAGLWASIPLLFGAFGNWFSGWLVDNVYSKGKWSLSRKMPAIIGFSLATIGLLGSTQMSEVTGAIIFLSIAIFGADMTLSPSWSFCIDIGKKNAGAVSGTMNMAGNIGAFLTALAFPYLKEWTGDVIFFFYLGALLNVTAIFCWLAMKPQQTLLQDQEKYTDSKDLKEA